MDNDKLITPETEKEFQEINRLIKRAKSEALKHVNKELINLYWNVGKFISNKLKSSQWGDAVVGQLAQYLQRTHPELKGFSRRGLYRMRQFYETYIELENVSTLLTQIPWSSHLHIIKYGQALTHSFFKTPPLSGTSYSTNHFSHCISDNPGESIAVTRWYLSEGVSIAPNQSACSYHAAASAAAGRLLQHHVVAALA